MTWMAGIPRTSISFFFSFIRPAHSGAHAKKTNIKIIAAEINNFLSFIFVFLLSHSGWPYKKEKKKNAASRSPQYVPKVSRFYLEE